MSTHKIQKRVILSKVVAQSSQRTMVPYQPTLHIIHSYLPQPSLLFWESHNPSEK